VSDRKELFQLRLQSYGYKLALPHTTIDSIALGIFLVLSVQVGSITLE